MSSFNYQKKIWGSTEIKLTPTYLGYLRLKYALEDFKGVSGRVLDAGCGAGGFAKAIKHHRPDLAVHGVDIAKDAIDFARKDTKGVVFSVGDLYKLSYKDRYFDGVVVEDVLEHLEKPEAVIKEISRVLKPKGTLSAFIPLEGEPYTLYFWFEKLGWRTKEKLAGHIQKFKLSKLTSLLKQENLLVKKRRYSGHLFGPVVDIGYFTYLGVTRKKLKIGLEQHLEGKPFLIIAKNLAAIISNFESTFFRFMPGSGVHILCKRKN